MAIHALEEGKQITAAIHNSIPTMAILNHKRVHDVHSRMHRNVSSQTEFGGRGSLNGLDIGFISRLREVSTAIYKARSDVLAMLWLLMCFQYTPIL